MSDFQQPLLCRPVYKDYLWGSDRILRAFHRDEPPGTYAESWEVSTRPEGMTIIDGGSYDGVALSDLITQDSAGLLGDNIHNFPLLIKLIDAAKTLSVQVHPNDESAARHGGEAKTEMWYVLAAAEGAGVYAGLKSGVNAEALLDLIKKERAEEALNFIPVQAGDAIYIPGGCVHAIASGCLLLEVQQNSNTTYRLYDWGRVGADGKPRPLHIDEALKVIDWQAAEHPLVQPRPVQAFAEAEVQVVKTSPYFKLTRVKLSGSAAMPHEGGAFSAVFAPAGGVLLSGDGFDAFELPAGRTALLPAALDRVRAAPCDGIAELLMMQAV